MAGAHARIANLTNSFSALRHRNFRYFWIGQCISLILGFFSVVFMTTANSTVQLNSADQYRSRTMSVYTLAFAGTTPIGNFLAGSVTEKLGANAGFFACGFVTVICIAMILIWMWGNRRRIGTA